MSCMRPDSAPCTCYGGLFQPPLAENESLSPAPEGKDAGDVDARSQLLRDARRIVTSNRNKQYGEPEDNFRRIANLWNDYLSDIVKNQDLISPHDVAAMMVLLKLARIQHDASNRDSWLDAAGYIACGYSTIEGKA